MLRIEARRHSSSRDALLHILGRPDTLAPEAADYEHKSTSVLVVLLYMRAYQAMPWQEPSQLCLLSVIWEEVG